MKDTSTQQPTQNPIPIYLTFAEIDAIKTALVVIEAQSVKKSICGIQIRSIINTIQQQAQHIATLQMFEAESEPTL